MKLNQLPPETPSQLRSAPHITEIASATVQAQTTEKLRPGHLLNAKTFHAAYMRLFAPLCLIALVVSVLKLGFHYVVTPADFAFYLKNYPFALATAIATVVVYTALVMYLLRVSVNAEGIEASDFWGKRHALHWHEMVSAKKLNICGIPCILAKPAKGPALWIPLVAKDRPAFLETLQAYAPPGSTFWKALNR